MLAGARSGAGASAKVMAFTVLLTAVQACQNPSDPGRVPATLTITRAVPATVGTPLRPPSARVQGGTIVALLSDMFGHPGYTFSVHANATSSVTGKTVRLTIETAQKRGIFQQTVWMYEYEVSVSVPAGEYNLEVIRKRDQGPTDVVEYAGRVVVP